MVLDKTPQADPVALEYQYWISTFVDRNRFLEIF